MRKDTSSPEERRSSDDLLDSWKEIASHLGRTIRTAQRWERHEKLPVHRHVHKKGSTVYAYRSEVDAWRIERIEHGSDGGEAGRVEQLLDWRPWAIVGVVAIGIAVLSVFVWPGLFDPGAGTGAEGLGFAERDWVLIADLENRTGEATYEAGIREALTRALSNSGFVNVVPPERIGDTLRLMGEPLDARVDRALAREVAVRDGAIRAVLTGSVEKLGTAWVVSADLVDPRNDVTAASLSERVQDEEELLGAIHRLSSQVRQALGEALSTIQEGEEGLRRVSTPSLRALELYSKADRLFEQHRPGADGNQAAEALLRDAIEEDPDFASAYTHLAWAIQRQNRHPEQALRYAEKATKLVDRATLAERYFIRGSYHYLRYEPTEALPQFAALLEIEPDHRWANWNISTCLRRLGRHEEALEYILRAAELRPNSFVAAVIATRSLVQIGGRLEEATAYAERAEKIWHDGAGQNSSALELWYRAYLDLRPIHELWLRGDLEGVLRVVDGAVESLDDQPPPAAAAQIAEQLVMDHYADLGMLEEPREILLRLEPRKRRGWEFRKAWLTDDRETAKEVLLSRPPYRKDPENLAVRALALARFGFLPESEEFLAQLAGHRGQPVEALISLGRGTLAFASGRYEEATPLLEEGLLLARSWADLGPYALAAETLAQAWAALGRPEEGVRVLEEVSRQKSRFVWKKRHWMKAQLRLAELYRRVGREAEARAVEEELRLLTVYADPEVALVQELRSREHKEVSSEMRAWLPDRGATE